jgi:glutamate racemase
VPISKARDVRALAPVGVFDSGVGGLTVLRALAAALPGEDFVYLGDTARLPYGTKSAESIRRYALQAAALLRERGVKCLVVACNTASAVALDELAAGFAPVPVLGVVEPGAAAACAATRSGHIAVVATESTVRGGAYQAAIHRLRPAAVVAARACPLFVALAEEGWTEGPVVEAVIHRYLDDLFGGDGTAHPDTLVLGCTHFPVLAPAIRDVLGEQVAIVDSAETTAAALVGVLERAGLSRARAGAPGHVRLLATDSAERFARVGGTFLGRPLQPGDVEVVDL